MGGANITLTFATKILDHNKSPPESHTKTVLRLVMPRESALATAEFINKAFGSDNIAPPPAMNVTLN